MDVISPTARQTQEERPAEAVRGTPIALAVIGGYALATVLEFVGNGAALLGVILYVVGGFGFGGLVAVQPNQAAVLILFGRYIGTITEAGFWCRNPFAKVRTISLRVRSFQTKPIKVNDAAGNPIEIGAVVVWRVTDTAKAVFDVDDYEQFVPVQSETALRRLAGRYPYDDPAQPSGSLRGNTDEVHQALQTELQDRLAVAGIEVIETRLTHLAYASEIAALMLRRQQADAIIAARWTIAQGATELAQMAVAQLAASELVELDPERQAAMAANLLVVLSGDRSPKPVINTASLYT
jgi:regulator of protease activity HflC (stomatin/prohibitin superfamily)